MGIGINNTVSRIICSSFLPSGSFQTHTDTCTCKSTCDNHLDTTHNDNITLMWTDATIYHSLSKAVLTFISQYKFVMKYGSVIIISSSSSHLCQLLRSSADDTSTSRIQDDTFELYRIISEQCIILPGRTDLHVLAKTAAFE